MWKKNLNFNVTHLDHINDRIVEISIELKKIIVSNCSSCVYAFIQLAHRVLH
jgi:hypothetical protein